MKNEERTLLSVSCNERSCFFFVSPTLLLWEIDLSKLFQRIYDVRSMSHNVKRYPKRLRSRAEVEVYITSNA